MMGKMNRPARNATPKSATAIVTASLAKFSFDLRYDAYVMSAPIPRLSEKNACPAALVMIAGSSSSLSCGRR